MNNQLSAKIRTSPSVNFFYDGSHFKVIHKNDSPQFFKNDHNYINNLFTITCIDLYKVFVLIQGDSLCFCNRLIYSSLQAKSDSCDSK